MTLPFTKAHTYGNDFLYVMKRDVETVALDSLAREMCDRHTGIGADGLIVYERRHEDISMRLFNADGGTAEVSGNGLRALGALLLLDDVRPDAAIRVLTDAGEKSLTRTGRDGMRQTFRAGMGSPAGLRQMSLPVIGEQIDVVVLNMGNPHCVLLGSLPGRERFSRLGGALERHEVFPQGTNVEFVDVEAGDRLRILIWERGVGPTASSGTGSCASLVAAAAYGGADRDAEVVAPGGSQRVEWKADGVYLTGWAEVTCDGRWMRPLPAAR
jgi:diaminopimelate epimerase